jgi:3',5'-cyclic AMP phosphodiesterase CpdA
MKQVILILPRRPSPISPTVLRRIFEGEVDGEYVNEYPSFVLHTGDLANAGGAPLQWIPRFFRPAGALVSRVPVSRCVGNHETSGDSGAAKYKAVFKPPENAPNAADKERYYWFDYRNCRFVVLDTDYGRNPANADASFEEHSVQHDWLCERLNESSATWKIVVMHVPVYTQTSDSRGYDAGDVSSIRTQLAQKVFNDAQYGVRLVLSGHNHFYERSTVLTEGGGTVE